MGDVVGFPEKEDRVFICNCGCCTYYVHDDWLECAACGVGAQKDERTIFGAWDLRENIGPQELQNTDIVRDFRQSDEGAELSFRRIQRDVMDEGVVAVALFYGSGRVKTVGTGAETKKERDWVRRRADDFVRTMSGKDANNS